MFACLAFTRLDELNIDNKNSIMEVDRSTEVLKSPLVVWVSSIKVITLV